MSGPLDSDGSRMDFFLPAGSPTGSAKDILDTACGLRLGDPTA